MPNKTVSLCDKSHKIASDMENFSGWLREELLKFSPEHQQIIENRFMRHGYECMRCDKINWFNRKLHAAWHCQYCDKPMIYMGHLDMREYA